jgi:hypothetical protein
MLRYFIGAADVLTNWCGYCGPGGMKITSPARTGTFSPATRKVPSPSRMTKLFLGVVEVVRAAAHAGRQDVEAGAVVERRAALAAQLDGIDIAHELAAQFLGARRHRQASLTGRVCGHGSLLEHVESPS